MSAKRADSFAKCNKTFRLDHIQIERTAGEYLAMGSAIGQILPTLAAIRGSCRCGNHRQRFQVQDGVSNFSSFFVFRFFPLLANSLSSRVFITHISLSLPSAKNPYTSTIQPPPNKPPRLQNVRPNSQRPILNPPKSPQRCCNPLLPAHTYNTFLQRPLKRRLPRRAPRDRPPRHYIRKPQSRPRLNPGCRNRGRALRAWRFKSRAYGYEPR